MKKPVTVNVYRDYDKFRYVLEFKKDNIEWSMFLTDEVYDDPKKLSQFLRTVVSEVQLKN